MAEGRTDYPAQQPLTVPQLDTGGGEVRLLLCTTRDRLAKMLSVLWESRGLQPIVWNDPESGADLDTLDHMIDLLESLAFLNDNINEAPCWPPPDDPIFWDDPDSVDGQEDSGGESGLLEMIGDWIIEGFLAATVSPAAALVYKTVIPRARVALRTGNLGALFQIVVDGVGVVATGDTYSATPDILEVEFDTGPAGIFRVEHGGGGAAAALGASPQSDSYRLEVVRGDIRPYPEGGTMPTYTLAWDNVTCTIQLLADGVPVSSVPLDNSCLVGPPGPQGLQGPTGPQGPPGADGQDADCDTCRDVQIDVNIEVPNPDNLPPDDIACNIASFITDLVLPSAKDRLDQATAEATTEKQLAVVVLETIGTLGAGFVLGPAGIVFGAAVTGTGGITSIFWDSKGSAFIAPADMWQQLKCIIHCEIINSDQEAYTTAVNAAVVARLGELLPLAQQETIDWLSLQLGLLSAEGFQWLNYYGALWEGSNCAACGCGGEWTLNIFGIKQQLTDLGLPWEPAYNDLFTPIVYGPHYCNPVDGGCIADGGANNHRIEAIINMPAGRELTAVTVYQQTSPGRGGSISIAGQTQAAPNAGAYTFVLPAPGSGSISITATTPYEPIYAGAHIALRDTLIITYRGDQITAPDGTPLGGPA